MAAGHDGMLFLQQRRPLNTTCWESHMESSALALGSCTKASDKHLAGHCENSMLYKVGQQGSSYIVMIQLLVGLHLI